MSKHEKHHSASEHKAESSKKESKIESKSESNILGFGVNTILLLAVLVILTALVSTWAGFSLAQNTVPAQNGSVDTNLLSVEVENYINANLLAQEGVSAKITGSKEIVAGLYEMPFEIYQDGAVVSNGNVYSTKEKLFLVQAAFDLNTPIEQPATEEPEASAEMVKSDKPKVELFIMSFCPYGIQAYDAFKPAVELLKSSIDFSLGYIIYPDYVTSLKAQGYTAKWEDYCTDANETYCSMHGIGEVNEDVRQMCIQKYQSDKLFDYMSLISVDYAAKKVSASNIDSLWESYAKTANVDVAKVKSCFDSERLSLLAEQLALTNSKRVSGSPTALINGVNYTGGRTSEAFKTSVCSAFNTAPTDCSAALSGAATAANGSC